LSVFIAAKDDRESLYTLCSEKKHPLSFSSISPWKMFRFIQNFQGMYITKVCVNSATFGF